MLRVTPIEPGRPDTDEPRPSPLRVGTANASCEVPQRMLSKPVIPSQPSRCEGITGRSEEHTSELQSRGHLVCRLLLEKKKEKEDNKSKNSNDSNNKQQRTDLTEAV